jgi:hypothetical protein
MYGSGVTGPDPQQSRLWMIGGAVGFCVLLAIATGVVLVPGLVLIAGARWAINQPRGVGVADQGIVVTKESFWNARPTAVLAKLPLDQLFFVAGSTATHLCVQLGTEHVWLRRKEHEILAAAAQVARSRVA